MSVSKRWARTDKQIALLNTAKIRGNLCGWCGRTLGDGETVYVELVEVGTRSLKAANLVTRRATTQVPVGVECASPELLERTRGQTPEPCVTCGRGVIYRRISSRRSRTTCSRDCAARHSVRRHKASAAEG